MYLWIFLLFEISLVFDVSSSSRGEWGQIKINEPRQSYSSNSHSNNANSNTASSSSSYRDPHSETENSEMVNPSVTEYLIGRKGEIIEGTHDKYTYKVNLFSKVEQSENWYSWNLGIFDKWDFCDDTNSELCLIFDDGQVCGNGHGRASYVHIVCNHEDKDSTKEALFDITEPLTCQYHMKMYIPDLCQLLDNDMKNLFTVDNKISTTNSKYVWHYPYMY